MFRIAALQLVVASFFAAALCSVAAVSRPGRSSQPHCNNATTTNSGSRKFSCGNHSTADGADAQRNWRASFQLRRRLFASFAKNNYDRRVPPTSTQASHHYYATGDAVAAAVAMNMDTRMLSLELVDDAAKILAAVIYVKLTWRDDRLSWIPEQYENLTNIDVSVSEIWLPSLRLLEWSLNEKRSSTSHTNTRWFANNDNARISRTATESEGPTEGINKDYSYGQASTAHYSAVAAAAAAGEKSSQYMDTIDNNGEDPMRYQDVRLTHNGTITFSGFIIDEIFCPSWNIYHFPFDKQACLITLYLPHVTLGGGSRGKFPSHHWTQLQMTEAQISGDWYDSSIFVAEFRLPLPDNEDDGFTISNSSEIIGSVRQHVLLLERMPTKHVIITVIPAIALTLFAIIGCFLACEGTEMYNFSANIITSLVLLYIGIDNEVPIASQNFPVIGYYYLSLLCISFVALVLAKSVHVQPAGPLEGGIIDTALIVQHNEACQYGKKRMSIASSSFSHQTKNQQCLPNNMFYQVHHIHEGWRWFFLVVVCLAFCVATSWAWWQWSTAQWPIDKKTLLNDQQTKTTSVNNRKTYQFIQSYLTSML